MAGESGVSTAQMAMSRAIFSSNSFCVSVPGNFGASDVSEYAVMGEAGTTVEIGISWGCSRSRCVIGASAAASMPERGRSSASSGRAVSAARSGGGDVFSSAASDVAERVSLPDALDRSVRFGPSAADDGLGVGSGPVIYWAVTPV